MKTIYLALALLALGSCSGGSTDTAAEEKPKFDVYTFGNTEWVEKDLSTISPIIHATVKVPKDAVLTKNEFDGIDIKMGKYYVIKVGLSVDESLEAAKRFYTMGRTEDNDAAKDLKIVIDEPNGIVYTHTSILDGSEPESHFYYVTQTSEADKYITFKDEPPFLEDIPGSAFPLENAKKAYEMIKSSLKVHAAPAEAAVE